MSGPTNGSVNGRSRVTQAQPAPYVKLHPDQLLAVIASQIAGGLAAHDCTHDGRFGKEDIAHVAVATARMILEEIRREPAVPRRRRPQGLEPRGEEI